MGAAAVSRSPPTVRSHDVGLTYQDNVEAYDLIVKAIFNVTKPYQDKFEAKEVEIAGLRGPCRRHGPRGAMFSPCLWPPYSALRWEQS